MPSRTQARSRAAGRTTPRKGQVVPAGPARLKGSMLAAVSNEKWDINESRSVRTGWIWRGFLVLTLLAVGVAIIMEANHKATLAILWVVIAGGWFATAMWLWRLHSRYMKGE